MPTDEQHPPSRSLKPQMEKRRRARINDSLLQLKNLVLDALNKNNPRHSKLEKADILEMTVRYLRSIHRQQLSGIGSQNEQVNIAQYQTGYAECMREVSRYLNTTSNTNHAPNQAAILQNLMNREARERHLQASLLDHLVTRGTDYNTGAERMTIQEQKNAADTPNLGHSNNIPTLQFYMANEMPSMTSLKPPDAAASRLHEETGGEGLVNLVQSSIVFSEGASVATLDPMACPPVHPTGPMAGEEIKLVLPGNLVYSGQIPTHLIPIYAASSPTISPAQLQPSTVLSNIPSLSPSTHVVLTPVAPGNGHASNLLGSAVASESGGFAFLHTPPSTCSRPPAPDSTMDSTDKPRQSVMSSQASVPTVTNNYSYLDDSESCDINPCMIPSSFSISHPISSSSSSSSSSSPSSSTSSLAHDNTPPILPSTTSPSPSPRTTLIEQPSRTQSRSHPVNTEFMTESTTLVTKSSPNQNSFRSVAPSVTTIPPLIPASGLIPVQNTHSISLAAPAPASQQPVTHSETSSRNPFRTPSVNSYARKRRRTAISHDKETLGVQNTTPPAPHPRMGSNQDINKFGVSRSDMRPTATRCRSPHRSRFIPDRPVGQLPIAPHPPANGPEINERCDVNELGLVPRSRGVLGNHSLATGKVF